MRYPLLVLSLCISLLLALPGAFAQTAGTSVQTDWLELVKGYRDLGIGAEVVGIEEGDTADTRKISLSIPKTAIASPDAIEEVLVIGTAPPKPTSSKLKPLDIQFEWVADYDKDHYGLVIRLGKNTNWPIRLYMNSEPGFVR